MQSLRELRSVVPLLALLAFISFVATGCGGGGSSETPANLSETSIKIINTDGSPVSKSTLVVAHPFTVELNIASTTAIAGVAVDFFIINQESVDAPSVAGDDVAEDLDDYFFVGTSYLEELIVGENIRQVELVLPYTTWNIVEDENGVEHTVYDDYFLVPNTDYYLLAVIDPGDLVTETDEKDNRPSAENLDQTMVIVSVDSEYQDIPNIVIEEIVLEVPSFEVTAAEPVVVDSCGETVPVEEDEPNSHLGVTAVINASGKYWPDGYPNGIPGPIPRVDIQAILRTPGLTMVPDIPLKLWVSPEGEGDSGYYSDTLKIWDIEPGTPMSVSLELRLPGAAEGVDLNSLVGILAQQTATCIGTCDLDRPCFVSQVQSGGSCDLQDLTSCGGSVDPVMIDPDWSCFVNRIDGECLDQCDPDINCIISCTDDLVGLEVKITAFNEWGKPILEPDFIIDNDLEVDLVMLPPPELPEPAPTDPVMFETGFDKSFSAKLAYAGMNAHAWAGLDDEGASAGLEAALPVVLFRSAPSDCDADTQDCLFDFKTSELFLGVTSTINAVPVSGSVDNVFDNLSTVGLYAFGHEIFSKTLDFGCENQAAIPDWNLGGLECALDCGRDYPTIPNETPAYKQARTDCLSDCWAIGKSTSINKNFVVGVVPLTASFAAWGLIGVEVGLELVDSCVAENQSFTFETHTGPWADLGTQVSAGVGSSALSAGVGGELNPLLGDTFFATVSVSNLAYDFATPKVTGTLHEDVTNTLTGPKGNVFFYVSYPCIKFCKKWGIPYPCKFTTCQAKKPIVGFKTFERKDVLFCEEQEFVGSAN